MAAPALASGCTGWQSVSENLLMNGRPSVVHQSLLCLGLMIFLSGALSVRAALIDASVKTSTEANTVRAAVGPFIQAQVATLQKDDPAAQSSAREALTAEASLPGSKSPSSTYLDIYSEELNKALLPVLDNPNMRVRLNAAIAAARVAQAAQTIRLAELAQKALEDKQDAVVIWGLQIARFTIPAVSNNPVAAANDKLVPAVVKFVTEHPRATVTQYGYDALMLDVLDVNAARGRNWSATQWKSALQHVIPAVQTVFRKRLDQFQQGVPDDPQ
ncbi:MAG TPA: hypothetical protein VL282_01215, partial [Tepidisphaeraceae bacterium]|nr:hypothetical protein [Tepidisphaeraceae bacterium]